MSEAQLRRYRRESGARSRHRLWYWNEHDRGEYTCPYCGATEDETRQFDVHHRDTNPLNGNPENLIGLCWECHLAEHGRTARKRTLEEWKTAFLELGDSDEIPYSQHTVYVADGGSQ